MSTETNPVRNDTTPPNKPYQGNREKRDKSNGGPPHNKSGERKSRPPRENSFAGSAPREEREKKPKLSPEEMRKAVAAKMNKVFAAINQGKKDFPYKWHKDRRTAMNDTVKTIQSAFDFHDYEAADRSLDHVIQENHIPL